MLYAPIFKKDAQDRFVKNVMGHLGNAKSSEVKMCQLSVLAAVDQDLSDRTAKELGVPTVKPLQVKSAAEAVRFRAAVVKGLVGINNKAHSVCVS
ncbi:hypothetical protein FRC08_007950 [Ceratobasidium sp. 394]|nr:hypothetical protein FRC08_007950 [Ceratobasidium sp. 394]